MSRGDACFYCRNCGESTRDIKNNGWIYKCKLGMNNDALTDKNVNAVLDCPKGDPRYGFQVGGYYTHMWFEPNKSDNPNPCLEWYIMSDGEFPREDESCGFHICDFRQIERFVEFWGKELRRRGLIDDDEW